jgi:hypothetical protein
VSARTEQKTWEADRYSFGLVRVRWRTTNQDRDLQIEDGVDVMPKVLPKIPPTTEGDATHDWMDDAKAEKPLFPGRQAQYCRRCGIMRRIDHKHRPCPGKVRVVLR